MYFAMWFLLIQGVLGAFDTIYFHEWKAHLPAHHQHCALELRLHAIRDFIYAALFIMLPNFEWRGYWTGLIVLLLIAEITITLIDFVVEDTARKHLGGVYPGERITHALLGIVSGLKHLVESILRSDSFCSCSRGTQYHVSGHGIDFVLERVSRCAICSWSRMVRISLEEVILID